MDDTLWSLALALGCHMKEVRKPAARNWTHDERAMFHLLEGGLFDARAQDKPWDTSTQSMRYTAVMGDRLWSMYETERNRVGVIILFLCKRINRPLGRPSQKRHAGRVRQDGRPLPKDARTAQWCHCLGC